MDISIRLSVSLLSIDNTNKKGSFAHNKLQCLGLVLAYYIFFPAAKMLGPRIGRWDSSKEPAMGSATNTIIGVFMLWWAWIAFNQVKCRR